MGAYLSEMTAESLATECHVPVTAGRQTIKLLRTWAETAGREEVWLLPGLFGVVARWGAWRRDGQGDCASVCVWLASDGRARCTCVGSDVHNDNLVHERPTTFQHAGAMDAFLDELAGALGASSEQVRQHLLAKLQHDKDSEGDEATATCDVPTAAAGDEHAAAAAGGMAFHVVGALYVAVCPSPFGPLPVPLYLTHTRSSCGICPGARTRVCSHLSIAQESGTPHRSHRASAQSAVQSLEVSAVSRLPIPLHDCVAAVRANAGIAAKALLGDVFVVPAPVRCEFCTDRGQSHTLSAPTTKLGVIVCTRGFCKMEVKVCKCSSCSQWVSRDGRDEHIILLTMTSAATVTWVRSMALATSDGLPLTTVTTRWLRSARREATAGVLPRAGPTRSGRALRSLVLVGLRLMATKLSPALFTCHHCLGADGRYKFVSADSIWVGFGSGAGHVRFQHVIEPVPVNGRAVKAAYLVRGEGVRRVVRDVLKAKTDTKLHAKSVRAAELAIRVLLPAALPPDPRVESTVGETTISNVLGAVFNIKEATSKLLMAVNTGLSKYKTRSRVEAERRFAAARHLSAYISRSTVDALTTDKTGSSATPTPPTGASGSGSAASATPTATAPPTGLPTPPGGSALLPAPPSATGATASGSAGSATPTGTSPATGLPTPPRRSAPSPSPPPTTGAAASGSAGWATPAPVAQATAFPTPLQPGGRPGSRVPGAVVTRVTAPPPPKGKRKHTKDAADEAGSSERRTTRRRPACGRKTFNAGKGDVNTTHPHLSAAVQALDKDGRRELLSFITAITIDSVVLPFRPQHAETLRQLAGLVRKEDSGAEVREVLGMATSGEEIDDKDGRRSVVGLLRELRFMQLGVRSAVSLFKAMPTLSAVLADALSCVANAVDKFVLEWRTGPEKTVQYQDKWECRQRTQEDMAQDFKKAYPKLATHHERTGTCAPGLPQCRPEAFLWEEVLKSGMCSKHFAKAHKFSPGAMTFCCGCKHPLILAFTVLDRKEAPQVLLNMLLTRFARLPHFLIYDFACGAFRVALGKLGWLLMDCTMVSDRFHIFNHLCSDAFDPRSYQKMDGADTGAPEQRNAPIRRIQTTLQGMGVEPYTNLLAYQTAILNHEAQVKWALGLDRLPEDVDVAGEYFTRHPCQCCDDTSDESSDSELLEGARSDEEEREGGDASDSGSSASEGGDDEAQGMDDGTASHFSGDASAGSDVSRSSSDEKGDDDGGIDDASVGSMGE